MHQESHEFTRYVVVRAVVRTTGASEAQLKAIEEQIAESIAPEIEYSVDYGAEVPGMPEISAEVVETELVGFLSERPWSV